MTDAIDDHLPGAEMIRTRIEDVRRGHASVEVEAVIARHRSG